MSFEATIFNCKEDTRITVDDSDLIVKGAHADIFKVQFEGKTYALRLYSTKSIIKDKNYKANLIWNTERISPHPAVLWPQFFVETEESFGYLEELIDTRKHIPLCYILMGKAPCKDETGRRCSKPVCFKNTEALINAALHIAEIFNAVHSSGYLVVDQNGIYINPENGEVVVSSDDIITTSGYRSWCILGDRCTMAPELIERTQSRPSLDTDKHLLSTILFELLLGDRPFDGKLSYNIMETEETIRKRCGFEAVFIMHPTDDSNRPLENSNAANLWPLFPEYIRALFTTCFVKGITNPSYRPTGMRWMHALNTLRASVSCCDNCGSEELLTEGTVSDGKYICPGCGKKFDILNLGRKDRYAAIPGKNIYGLSVGDTAVDTILGTFAKKVENDTVQFGLVNRSGENWTVRYGNKMNTIGELEGFPITSGMTIKFVIKDRNNKMITESGEVN